MCTWRPVRAPFPPSVQRVLHQAAAFDFYLLPPTLAGDLALCAPYGPCWLRSTASRFVVSECQQRGIEARMAYGLLLAPPLGTPHEWAEIRLGDIWAPADPLLLSILGRFAGLDASRWPCTHSPNAVLLRLAACKNPDSRLVPVGHWKRRSWLVLVSKPHHRTHPYLYRAPDDLSPTPPAAHGADPAGPATHRYELTRDGRVRCLPWSPRRACPRHQSPAGRAPGPHTDQGHIWWAVHRGRAAFRPQRLATSPDSHRTMWEIAAI